MENLIPKLRFPEFKGEWEKKKFENILDITRLAGYEYSTYWQEDENKEIIALRGYNIGKGKLELNNLGYISNELSNKLIRSKLFKGDIVYPCVGTIGNAVVIEEDNKYHIQQNIAKLTPKENIYPYFITQFLMSDLGLNEVYKFNATSSQPNVLVGSLRNFEIIIPTLPEQQKIATFLTSVDEKLQALKKKKSLLEQYKKGVMQKIFSQELRFKDENGNEFPEWEEKSLGEVLIKNSNKNKGEKYSLVQSVSNKYGFINQDEMFEDRRVASKDTSNYYVIEKGYFAYNPSRIDVGSLAYKFDNEVSVISPLYISFKTKKEILTDEYLLNWFSTEQFLKQMNNSFEGSVRNTLSYESLIKMDVGIPSIPEQTLIANFLTSIDDKINHCGEQIAKMEVWKKGLLQGMFC